jgi:hypothetical protein
MKNTQVHAPKYSIASNCFMCRVGPYQCQVDLLILFIYFSCGPLFILFKRKVVAFIIKNHKGDQIVAFIISHKQPKSPKSNFSLIDNRQTISATTKVAPTAALMWVSLYSILLTSLI